MFPRLHLHNASHQPWKEENKARPSTPSPTLTTKSWRSIDDALTLASPANPNGPRGHAPVTANGRRRAKFGQSPLVLVLASTHNATPMVINVDPSDGTTTPSKNTSILHRCHNMWASHGSQLLRPLTNHRQAGVALHRLPERERERTTLLPLVLHMLCPPSGGGEGRRTGERPSQGWGYGRG